MKYSYRHVVVYSFYCVSCLSCTQTLIKYQTNYGRKLLLFVWKGENNSTDRRSSHWASVDCVHAACKCMRHEAGPTYLNPVQASKACCTTAMEGFLLIGALDERGMPKTNPRLFTQQANTHTHNLTHIFFHGYTNRFDQ